MLHSSACARRLDVGPPGVNLVQRVYGVGFLQVSGESLGGDGREGV